METSARLFNCACCSRQVIICSCCDRNNIYCCAECSRLARIKSLRAAGQRYQNSLKGKHKHADRQKRYRWRLLKKVTHHTSTVLPSNDLLPQQPSEQRKRLIQPSTCHFCGNCCSPFLRYGFLRRQMGSKPHYFSSWPGRP